MKRSHLIIVVLFFISAILFGFTQVRDYMKNAGSPPEISMDKATLEVSVNVTNEELLAGLEAWDEEDGDLTDQLLVESFSRFVGKGRRNVTIGVADSQGKVTEVTRNLVYTDYESPKFALTAPLYLPITKCDDPLALLTASDKVDGDISNNIEISSIPAEYGDNPGEYEVVFAVSNSAGDKVDLPVTVTIYDAKDTQGAPAITLSAYLVNVKKGDKIEPWDYVTGAEYERIKYEREEGGSTLYAVNGKTDEDDNVLSLSKGDFNIANTVDWNEEGVYEIQYRLEDENGHIGIQRLIVVVY